MLSLLLFLLIAFEAPTIQVIDLDGGEPRHVIVIIDGEPYKAVTLPAGSGPVPGPTPGPTPPPAPIPDALIEGTLWVTYIVPENPSVNDVAPTTHAPLRARIDGKNVSWRMQHATDAEIARRRFEEHAKNAPVAIFQDQAGKVLKTLQGNDPAAILTTIEGFKGKSK
ncbi:hypothetical protein UFOVP124_31 [uncultured Caudovirales phage]|uniref:Uncharacterized protein n=1 Tax=uncultured Caudovirales phage TaxID=2100421 RepID=A0A6J5LCX6_9CAUD|nr:hypothetical protein UFOVP124_31 [uncultured Caudovirales phage]